MEISTAEIIAESAIWQRWAVGLLIVILVVFVYMFYKYLDKKDKSHLDEREQRRQEMSSLTRSVTQALVDTKWAIVELSTIIKSQQWTR
jgi:hypothetical protein